MSRYARRWSAVAVASAILLITVVALAARDRQPPTAPVLSVTEIGTTHIAVRWTASTDDGAFIFYQIFVNGNASTWAGSNTSATVQGLNPATEYVLTVKARDNGINWSTSSNAVTVKTKPSTKGTDGAAPTTPGNLTGFDGGCGEAWLRWEASTDNVDPGVAIRYEVFVNGIARPESTVIGGTTTVAYAVVEGSNTFEVFAIDTAGNRSTPAALSMDLNGLCQ